MSKDDDEEELPPLQEATATIAIDYEMRLTMESNPEFSDETSAFTVSARLFGPFKKRDASGGKKYRELVGVLEAELVPRPNYDFFGVCDAISQEMQELSVTYCSRSGRADRVKHPGLTAYPSAVEGGGFLQIYTVEIHPDHQKKDLGLWMMHETVAALREHFTLAVAVPCCLGDHMRRWGPNASSCGPRQLSRDEERREEADTVKIQQHFARMGFHQAGQSRALSTHFFLARDQYFKSPAEASVEATRRWIPKDRAQTLDIYKVPKRESPTVLDRELERLLQSFGRSEPATLIPRIESLVHRGASTDRTHALHIAAANEFYGPPIIRALVRLGANVNCPDQDGETPLHLAASFHRLPAVETLVELGADLGLRNAEGKTPVECSDHKTSMMADFAATFGAPRRFRAEETGTQLQTILLLLPQALKDKLKDSWMSPRMHHRLSLTVDFLGHEGYHDGVVLRDAVQRTMPRAVFRRAIVEGSLKGPLVALAAINNVLDRNETPTVSKVQAEIEAMGSEASEFRDFVQRGGKIEQMLECVIAWTKDDVDEGIEDEDPEEYPVIAALDGNFDFVELKLLHSTR